MPNPTAARAMSKPRSFRRRQISPALKSKPPKINPTVTCIAGPIHFSSKAYLRKKPAASKRTKTPIPRNHFCPTATSVEVRTFALRGAAPGGGDGEENTTGGDPLGKGGGPTGGLAALAPANDSTNARKLIISWRSAASSECRLKSSEHFGQMFPFVSVWHLGQSIGAVRHGTRLHAISRLLTGFET